MPCPRRAPLLTVLLLGAVLPTPAAAQACDYWVAPPPAGSDSNPGTQAQPWATLDHASAAVLAAAGSGCTVWFQDGTYSGGHSLYERFASPTTFKAVNRYKAVLQHSGTVLRLFGARHMVFEGFELRHSGPGAAALVVQVQQDGVNWAEDVTLRDNVMHDSYNNDILKINNGARRILVQGNLFYNQAGSDEHMDVNSVTDVTVEDNVFFNDFPGSGRPNNNDTSSFIVIKDSNGADDGQIGSERITVRRNVFLNWQGSSGSNFVLVGEDGQAYFEARDVTVASNLMIGNAPHDMRAAFGVKGGQNVSFVNNTVVGDLPSLAYALRVNREGANPVNSNVVFRNNVWADPLGSMGAPAAGGSDDFSDGLPSEVSGLVLDSNLYWNGGDAIPPGDQVNPLVDDLHRVVADPLLDAGHAGLVLPLWNGTSFTSGSRTIRQEFLRLAKRYGRPAPGSPVIGAADPAHAPAEDLLGRPRREADLGAVEYAPAKGDFDRDGRTDLLLLRTSPAPELLAWLMNGTTRAASAPVTAAPAGSSWAVGGVDDFDADLRNDLLMWDSASGVVEFWLLNGVTRVGTAPLSGAAPLPPAWKPSASADFDGDGRPDVLWRNSVTRQLLVWTLNGTAKSGEIVPTPSQAVDANWEVVGALDVDLAGGQDLVWYNWSSGKIVLWFMDAALQRLRGSFATPASAGNANWKVLALGDYGVGPGGQPETGDLVWRNATSGRLVYWHLDPEGVRTAGGFLAPNQPDGNPLEWTVAGPR